MDIAVKATLFLASEDSSYLTATDIVVDGATSLHSRKLRQMAIVKSVAIFITFYGRLREDSSLFTEMKYVF